jgi:hypothetical protein
MERFLLSKSTTFQVKDFLVMERFLHNIYSTTFQIKDSTNGKASLFEQAKTTFSDEFQQRSFLYNYCTY